MTSTQLLPKFALLFVLGLTSLHAREAPPVFKNLEAGKAQTVVLYGTSLTAGGAWAKEVKKWFDASYPGLATVVNSAGPGQNSNWGLKNLPEKVLAHSPDLVFIEFSFNDAHEKFNLLPRQGAENLELMVKQIRDADANTTVVLQVMNAPWDAPNGNRSLSARPQLKSFNGNYRKHAEAHNLPLIDHYPAWNTLKETDPATYQSFVPDGTHPNAKGSLTITWPAIKSWLETERKKAQAR